MPQHVGGKSRLKKDIYNSIKEDLKGKEVKDFIEPFCGGLHITQMFYNEYDTYCGDNGKDLIYMYNYLKHNDMPDMPNITREKYLKLKEEEQSFEKSFALYHCSYKGKYSGGYIEPEYEGKPRKRHLSAYNGLKKYSDVIKKVKSFECKDYKEFTEQVRDGGHLIYCDPPYINTLNCYEVNNFNTEEFWKIMKQWKDMGNYVYVSEKICPIANEVIYEKEINKLGNGKTFLDKLFKIA